MRVLLCLNNEFMSNLALNRLRPALVGHEFEIVLSRGVGKPSAVRARAFEEWQSFERGLIEEELFPLIETRGADARWFQSFAQLARTSASGKPQEFAALNRDEGLAFVRGFAPDLIVSIRFGQIFKPPLIAIPRLGVVNLHSGILPDYRGILATFWAMLHGESEIGCTLHSVVDAGIDLGPIIGIRRRPVVPERSLMWNVASLYGAGTAMVADAIAALSSGRAIANVPQRPDAGHYFTLPNDDEMQRFLDCGYRLYSRDDYGELLQDYGVAFGKEGMELR